MVRTAKSHPEEEEDDAEDVAAGTDTSSHREGKSAEQKPSNSRSKHSETEQRRRSKINERFQILRDLIPPSDQKRDKASLLLEVIEYIQFLQEKLQVYEGSYQQVWGQEPAKLIPWRANHGPVDNFANHSQAMKNGSMDENNAAQPLTNMHSSVEPEFNVEYAYRGADHPDEPATPAIPLNIPLQPFVYPPPIRSIPPIENLASHPHGLSVNECAIVGNEGRTFESGSSSLSSVYSQGLQNKLTLALESSGVDLSQANISVQLDIGKQANTTSATASATEDVDKQFARNPPGSRSGELSGKDFVPTAKKLRTGET